MFETHDSNRKGYPSDRIGYATGNEQAHLRPQLWSPPPCTSGRGWESTAPLPFKIPEAYFQRMLKLPSKLVNLQSTKIHNPLSCLPEIQVNSGERKTLLCLPNRTQLHDSDCPVFTETQNTQIQQWRVKEANRMRFLQRTKLFWAHIYLYPKLYHLESGRNRLKTREKEKSNAGVII